MKIMVCGSIGYGGAERIQELQRRIEEAGFEVTTHFDSSMDYSDVTDFRGEAELIEEIVDHDLATVESADVIVALIGKPSFGTAFEMCYARQLGTPIIGFSEEPIPTPWPIHYSDRFVETEDELFEQLRELRAST